MITQNSSESFGIGDGVELGELVEFVA